MKLREQVFLRASLTGLKGTLITSQKNLWQSEIKNKKRILRQKKKTMADQILINMELEIKTALKFLVDHAGSLTPGQLELVKGLQRYYKEHKELSERQTKTLFEIRKYLNPLRTSQQVNKYGNKGTN